MGRFVYEDAEEEDYGEFDKYTDDEEFKECEQNQQNRNSNIVGFPIHRATLSSYSCSPSSSCPSALYNDIQTDNLEIRSPYHNPQSAINIPQDYNLADFQQRPRDAYVFECEHGYEEKKYRPTKTNYLKHFLIILLVILLQKYSPPPPPPNQSWHEFISQSTEGILSLTQNILLLTAYVSSGCFRNIYGDFESTFSTFFLRKEELSKITNKCALSFSFDSGMTESNHSTTPLQNMGNNKYDQNGKINYGDDKLLSHLLTRISSQDHAMEQIVDKVQEWNEHKEQKKRKRPLSMLLTGSNGVGKFETANQLAQILLSECDENTGHGQNVLTLQGLDYAVDTENIDDGQEEKGTTRNKGIVQTILDYLHSRRGAGTVIIVKHIENISSRQRLELLRLWGQSRVTYESSLNKHRSNNQQRWFYNMYRDNDLQGETVEVNLENAAFITTSEIGANKLFDVLLKSNGVHDSSLYNEISKAVENEINGFFGSLVFDVVTPFWPLRYWDMEKIVLKMMQHQLGGHKFKHIEIDDDAIRHLINPKNIDYFEFKLSEGSYFFSKNGGHNLNQFLSMLLDQIDEKIVSNSFYNEDDTVLLEYNSDNNSLSMKLCSEWTEDEKTCSVQMWSLSNPNSLSSSL